MQCKYGSWPCSFRCSCSVIRCSWNFTAKEDIALVVDNSSSMKQLDENLAIRDAIKAFSSIFPRRQSALILFDDNASLKMPFVPVSMSSGDS